MNKELFECSKEEYKAFVERLKPECKKVVTREIRPNVIAVEIFSKKTLSIWCGRELDYEKEVEKYYIYDFPEPEEWTEPVIRKKIELTTKEEVQSVIDFLQKHKDD